jgi:hypothetical protein
LLNWRNSNCPLPRASAAIFGVAILVGVYDLWAVRSAGYRFVWNQDLPGYYDYLGRAFAAGHLYLPIQPASQVLALSNPYDPAAAVDFKMHDMAYRSGRYYLYHGPAPALLLFAPFRLLTRHDLPENFALFLLCYGGFLFSAAALLRLLDLAGVQPSPAFVGLLLFAVAVCQCVPYLMSRVWVYEIAIGGAYFFSSAAIFFLLRGGWAASGLMFGLAVASRPHMLLAAAIALVAINAQPKLRAHLPVFAGTLTIAGIAIAAYNYARFSDPFEFGVHYLFAGANQNRVHLAAVNLVPGLYHFLFAAPEFGPVFPWVHLVTRPIALPPGYFIEPVAGALWFAPFLVAAFAIPRCAVRPWLRMLSVSSVAILLFLAATGFTTHRYEADFLPMLVLAALAVCVIRGWRAALVPLILYSAIVNLALGVTGPYEEMLRNRPQTFVRIARWFSPVSDYRPAMSPHIARDLTEPWIAIGGRTLHYELSARDHRLISKSDTSTVVGDLPAGTTPLLHFDYTAPRVTVSFDGRPILIHDVAGEPGRYVETRHRKFRRETCSADTLGCRRRPGPRPHVDRQAVSWPT